ncbi:MAG: DUF899 family protein [Rhodothermales bacterium]
MHTKRFPGESEAYRHARNELLEEELLLRKQIEAVARKRRSLPQGGALKENYIFERLNEEGEVVQVEFADLFSAGKDTLVLYNFMFAPEAKSACPSCTSIMDSLDGSVHHLSQQINFVACARAPIGKFVDWSKARGWRRLKMISSLNNTFNADYHAEVDVKRQLPVVHVFKREPEGIFHFYSSELFFMPFEPGQGPRHVDSFWPIWNVLDLTPEGRGEDWNPMNSYD